MATFLCTTFFTGGSSGGWSESYYASSADTVTAITDFSADLVFRKAILARGYFIREGRVSNVAVFRDSRIVEAAASLGEGTFPAAGAGAATQNEQVWDRLLLRCEATDLVRRPLYLGGIPRTVLSQDGVYLAPPAWAQLFSAWRTSVLGAPAPAQVKREPATGDTVQVLGVAAATFAAVVNPRAVTITLDVAKYAALAPAVGEYLRLSRSKGYSNLQGIWVIDSVDPVLFKVTLQPRRYLVGFPAAGGSPGWATKLADPTYPNMTAIIPIRGTRRKTGRPFDSLAGIQRNRAN